MTHQRPIHRLDDDLTRDYVDRLERLHGLADGTRPDPDLRRLDHVVWWMIAILFCGWILVNL